LDRDRDTVGASVITRMGGIIHHSGQQKTDRDGKLVRADDKATNPFRGRFRLVKGDLLTHFVSAGQLVRRDRKVLTQC
jgi:hypothetical protein